MQIPLFARITAFLVIRFARNDREGVSGLTYGKSWEAGNYGVILRRCGCTRIGGSLSRLHSANEFGMTSCGIGNKGST